MDDLNFNIYNITIITGIIHGLIFSSILLINKNLNSKSNKFLAFTVLSLALSNLQYMIMDIGLIPRVRYMNNEVLFIPFEFLILPFFYLFVKTYINKKVSKLERRYLFIPFIICLFYLLLKSDLSNNQSIIKFLNLILEYISILFSVLLLFLIFRLIKRYENLHSEYNPNHIIVKTKWLKRVLLLGLTLCALWFISLNLFEELFGEGFYKIYPLWIGMSILIYWIGYSSILQKHLYKEREQIRILIKNEIKPIQTKSIKKTNSNLYIEITDWIQENELYLNPDLNLNIITEKFNISSGYLSQIFNSNGEQNFNEFINHLRVKEVKRILKKEEYDSYTILAIGLEAGFNSKSSFYTAFKRFTNKTPIQYKKDVRNS